MNKKLLSLFFVVCLAGCASSDYRGNAESYEMIKRNIIYQDLTRPPSNTNKPLRGSLDDLKKAG